MTFLSTARRLGIARLMRTVRRYASEVKRSREEMIDAASAENAAPRPAGDTKPDPSA